MSGQKGRDVLIKIGDGEDTEAFVTVAGIRAKTISLNAKTVDGTSDGDQHTGGGVTSEAASEAPGDTVIAQRMPGRSSRS